MKKILLLFAHPAFQKSRINHKLVAAAGKLSGVTFHDLYENYPDFFIEVKKEQQLLINHDIIVWQHPFYWYNVPALLKEWMDLVLEHGFAYGANGNALEGKSLLSVISTGGRKEVYSSAGRNHYTMNQFLLPFKQSAGLCGMKYLPPFVVHGAHTITNNEIDSFADKYRKALILLRDGKIAGDRFDGITYLNDLVDSIIIK